MLLRDVLFGRLGEAAGDGGRDVRDAVRAPVGRLCQGQQRHQAPAPPFLAPFSFPWALIKRKGGLAGFLLEGNFFVGASLAGDLTKLAFRFCELMEKSGRPVSTNFHLSQSLEWERGCRRRLRRRTRWRRR